MEKLRREPLLDECLYNVMSFRQGRALMFVVSRLINYGFCRGLDHIEELGWFCQVIRTASMAGNEDLGVDPPAVTGNTRLKQPSLSHRLQHAGGG